MESSSIDALIAQGYTRVQAIKIHYQQNLKSQPAKVIEGPTTVSLVYRFWKFLMFDVHSRPLNLLFEKLSPESRVKWIHKLTHWIQLNLGKNLVMIQKTWYDHIDSQNAFLIRISCRRPPLIVTL